MTPEQKLSPHDRKKNERGLVLDQGSGSSRAPKISQSQKEEVSKIDVFFHYRQTKRDEKIQTLENGFKHFKMD